MSSKFPQLAYHFFPDTRHYTARDLNTWLPILQAHSAGWVTLHGQITHAIPEAFVRGLVDAGIQPIVHLPADAGAVKVRDLYPLLVSYARWGVRHVVVFDRPNIRFRWKDNAWGPKRLVERFLDQLVPILKLQREVGLSPVFPPLEPGGDYWDTAFLQSALVSLARRGEDSLLDELVLTAYGWTYGRALSWGAGGPEKWPESRPYHTPEESQDQLGFRIFEWYGSVASKILGTPLPTLIIAGGPTDSEGESIGSPLGVEQMRSIIRIILRRGLPDFVKAFCFYPFVADRQHSLRGQAWFSENGQAGAIAEAACEILDLAPQSKKADSKPIQHYLLLPEDVDPAQMEVVNAYLLDHQATAGFSIDEACSARHVTAMPSNSTSKKEIEAVLAHSGCKLEWLNPAEALEAPTAPPEAESRPIAVTAESMPQGADHG
jgi:hypothetical protein